MKRSLLSSSITLLVLAGGCRPVTYASFEALSAPAEAGGDEERRAGPDSRGAMAPPKRLAPLVYDEAWSDHGITAYTAPGDLPQIMVQDSDGSLHALALQHCDVEAKVRGPVASVTVKQRFSNDRSRPIEVSYIFPLPENAAVDGMIMQVGGKRIEAEIKTRAEARAAFAQAKAAGHTASLLEQERPNVFTQSLTNVPPGEAIEVELTYLQTLTQDAGNFEFVFPMVVGPRFMPGSPAVGEPGSGTHGNTDEVPDAARISPPIAGKGTRTGHDISLSIEVDAGRRLSQFESPTHRISAHATPAGFTAKLSDAKTLPNRDFVLRWAAGTHQPLATLFLGPKDASGEGHFVMTVQPPSLDLDEVVGRREMIFVVDRSGSMSGLPIALCKQVLRESLERLRPVDTFNVVGFASGTQTLFDTPRPANEHNLSIAERFIDHMYAGGGTMMNDAVEAALQPPVEGRNRYVFFLTDGMIGNEDAIISNAAELVKRSKKQDLRARVFGMGVGSSPNRHLIDQLSKAGDAVPSYLSNREHPPEAVNRYFHYVDRPILEELSVDWGGLSVEGVYPDQLPDLFASHSVVLVGRYSGVLSGDLVVAARTSDGHRRATIPVTVAASSESERVLSTLWARAKVDELSARRWDGELAYAAYERELTELGLDYALVTEFTSFVAVDESRTYGDGDPQLVDQGVERPEDVDVERAGGLTFGMDQSRDFKAVVDLSPTALRDVAGISLAGTSAAENTYAVDGANASSVSMEVRMDGVELETVGFGGKSDITTLRGGSWEYKGRFALEELVSDSSIDGRKFKRSLKAIEPRLEQCYADREYEHGKRHLSWRLRFDASGALAAVEVVSAAALREETRSCIDAALSSVDWKGVPRRAGSVELRFTLRLSATKR